MGFHLENTTLPATDIPMIAEFVDEEAPPDGPPIGMDQLIDGAFLSDPLGNSRGSAVLCRAGENEIAVKGALSNGLPYLLEASLYPNDQSPTYLCVPSVSLETWPPPVTRALLNVYIPVRNNRTLTMAWANAPSDLLVRIDLDNLPDCAQRVKAPSLSMGVLVALLVAVLAFGTWAAGRRTGFREVLALL